MLLEKMKEKLRDEYACYILITCGEPSSGGEMQVEMSYEGDEVLASYLIDHAQQLFEERSKSRKSE